MKEVKKKSMLIVAVVLLLTAALFVGAAGATITATSQYEGVNTIYYTDNGGGNLQPAPSLAIYVHTDRPVGHITMVSSNPNVIDVSNYPTKVDEYGICMVNLSSNEIKGKGSATLTFSDGADSTTFAVKVYENKGSITIDKPAAAFKFGDSTPTTFTVNLTGSGITPKAELEMDGRYLNPWMTQGCLDVMKFPTTLDFDGSSCSFSLKGSDARSKGWGEYGVFVGESNSYERYMVTESFKVMVNDGEPCVVFPRTGVSKTDDGYRGTAYLLGFTAEPTVSSPGTSVWGASIYRSAVPGAFYFACILSGKDEPKLDAKTGLTLTFTSGSQTASCAVFDMTDFARYDVTFDGNSPSGAVINLPESKKLGYNATARSPLLDPALSGYVFGGWFTDQACQNEFIFSDKATAEKPATLITGDTPLYAKWTANTYTVSYKDLDNQTYSGDNLDSLVKTHTYGTDTTLVSGTKTDTDTTKFMFEGWFDSSACTGTKIPTLGATAYTADITLYARWIQTITPTGGKAQIPSGEQKIVPVAPSSPEVKMIEVDGVNGEVTFSQTSAVPTPTAPSQGYTDLKVFAKFDIVAITGADTRFVIDIKNQHGIYSSKNIFLRHHSTGGWDDKHIEGTQLSAETGTLRLSFPVKECSPFAIVYETPVKKSGGSSSSQGSSTWLTEPAAAEQPAVTPTPTPTPGAVETPGVKPVNPSEIPAKTPAPFVGILAGLGCAAALFSLRRK